MLKIYARVLKIYVQFSQSGQTFLIVLITIVVPTQIVKMRAELASLNHCAVRF